MKLSSYRKTMAQALAEAQMVSDISGISITALKREARKFNIQVARVTPGGPMGAEYEVTFSGREQDLIKYAKEHLGFDDKPGSFQQLKKHLNMSYNDIEEISDKLKLKVLARNIKKLKDKFLKKAIPGTGAMFAQKEEVELDEGKMKDIFIANQEGQSAKEISKRLKIPLSTVKAILGEDVKEEVMVEFSDSMLDKLAREYEPLKNKTISVDQANKLRKIFDRIPDRALDALRRKKIPFLSGLALSRMIKKGMPVKEEAELEEKFALYALQDFIDRRAPGGKRKKGDRVSGPMTYTQAVSKAKQMNAGSSVGVKKDVEVRPMKEESELNEFLSNQRFTKMKATFPTRSMMDKAKTHIIDFENYGFDVEESGLTIKVDGNGSDLNKYAKDLRNQYGARVVAEETEIEESAAAAEIQRTNTRRDSMDYGMYKKAVELLRTKQYAKLGKHIYDAETAPREYVMGVIAKKEPGTFRKIYGNQAGYYSLMKPKLKEELELEEQTMIQKAKEIAKKFAGNMTRAVIEIEKLQKGLSKNSAVASALKSVNEDNLKEFKKMIVTIADPMKRTKAMKDIEGQGFKIQRLGSRDFKVDGKGADLNKYATDLKNFYGATIKAFDYSLAEGTIDEANIDVDNVKKGDTDKEKELKIKLDKEKDQDTLEKQLIAAQGQINILKQKLENEKNKALKPEPNRETGEVPLTVGVAYKHFRDKQKKEVKDAPPKVEEFIKEARYLVDVDVQFNNRREESIEIVIDTPYNNERDIEKDLENKADIRITQLMKQRKFGPSGARIDNLEVLNYERTSKPTSYYQASAMMGEDLKKEGGPGSGPQLGDKRGTYKTGHKKSVMKPGAGKRPGSAPDGGQTDKEADDYDTEIGNFGEADLTKPEIKKVHKLADKLPKDSFRDRYGKKQGDSVRYATATKMVKKKLGIKEDRRLYVETIAGLKKKAEKSGMPYSILKKVYDRGMAAWKGGHRPGATQQQWAFARVNSFVTKSSGTWGGADKDLAAKVRGSK